MAAKKTCPECGTKLHIGTRTCDVCKFYFADYESRPSQYEPSKTLEEKEYEETLDWYKTGLVFFNCIQFICLVALCWFVAQCAGS